MITKSLMLALCRVFRRETVSFFNTGSLLRWRFPRHQPGLNFDNDRLQCVDVGMVTNDGAVGHLNNYKNIFENCGRRGKPITARLSRRARQNGRLWACTATMMKSAAPASKRCSKRCRRRTMLRGTLSFDRKCATVAVVSAQSGDCALTGWGRGTTEC